MGAILLLCGVTYSRFIHDSDGVAGPSGTIGLNCHVPYLTPRQNSLQSTQDMVDFDDRNDHNDASNESTPPQRAHGKIIKSAVLKAGCARRWLPFVNFGLSKHCTVDGVKELVQYDPPISPCRTLHLFS